jgi:hypothetical protein
MFFLKAYTAKKIKIDNILESRKKVFQTRNSNLAYLLNKRFLWMKKFIKNKKNIIEVGSGNGCIKSVLKSKKIVLTDLVKYSWIDKKLDMKKMNLGRKYYNKVDVFIFNHSLHHCSNPAITLKRISKYLKKDGLIIMNEPEASFFLRIIQYVLDDEGWSYSVNVFNNKKDIFKSDSPWQSNTAIANLLFSNTKKFNEHFPYYKIIKNDLSEFFIFINSSGVSQSIFHIPLNNFFNNILNFIDRILIFIFPKIFALNRSIVIRKN